jgi:hypothetical protein
MFRTRLICLNRDICARTAVGSASELLAGRPGVPRSAKDVLTIATSATAYFQSPSSAPALGLALREPCGVPRPLFSAPNRPTLGLHLEQQHMPRKTKPKYGIDPVQKVPAFSFDATEVERLLDALGPVKGKPDDIVARLQQCVSEYRWRRDQNEGTPTRAEQNAALKEVLDLARKHGKGLRSLEVRLRSLDMRTESELLIGFSALLGNNFTDQIANFVDSLEPLARAAEQALRAGKQESGPRVQTHVQRTVERLATLYEEFTGQRFSHNPKLLERYDGQPHSRAGRFIVAFFEIVDPKVTATSLSTTMASIVKFSRARETAARS